MPNHITNSLEIIAPKAQVNKVREYLKGAPYDDGEECPVDFNNMIPMPKSLNISVHGGVIDAANMSLHVPVHENDLIGMLETSTRKRADSPVKFNNEDWAHYLTCLQNIRDHGHAYWYDWACEEWGTKWNAYDIEVRRENLIYFDTAWSGVPNLVNILSKEFPLVKFNYEFADEDIGNNTGRGMFVGGKSDFNKLKNESVEAYELAFKLIADSEIAYIFKNGSYEYVEE